MPAKIFSEKGLNMYLLIGIISVIVLIYPVWQRRELKKFRVTRYQMQTHKISSPLRIAVIADLHSFTYGIKNSTLLAAVKNAAPDLILIPGDLIVTSKIERYGIALDFVRRLVTTGVPVICTNGNHESKAQQPESDSYMAYRQYLRQLKRSGVRILNNESCKVALCGTQVCISGLELPLSSYKKGKRPYLEEAFIKRELGAASDAEGHLQILLAHHPAFAEQYAAWGADLTVCGHNHGGLVSIPGLGSVISPQFVPFPKYDAGEFTVSGKKIYISRGLGTHTFHIRIFNRAELVVITVKPQQDAAGRQA